MYFREASLENSVTYIQATAPQIIKMSLGQNLNHPESQAELELALECLVFLESMLEIAEAERKSQLLNIHIPVLINFLSDDPNSAPQFKRYYFTFINLSLSQMSTGCFTRLPW